MADKDAKEPKTPEELLLEANAEDEAELQTVMEEQIEADDGFTKRKNAIQARIDKRARKARLEAALEGLGPDERKAALADMED